jgi:spore germination cell wall hydrolase CwlJ-like protein
MRYLLACVALLVPTACGIPNTIKNLGLAGYGRGLINPPTVAEMREIKCLATMVYGEARGEKETGMIAVAYSAVNRAKKKTLCDVVLAPKQYSIFNNNPALRMAAMSAEVAPKQKNVIDNAGWKAAKKVAAAVVRGEVPDPTAGATHYVADKVMLAKGYKYPKWTKTFQRTVVIQNHTFFKESFGKNTQPGKSSDKIRYST